MADRRYMQDYPQQSRPEDRRTASGLHQYPQPQTDDPQQHPPGPKMAASVSLPSIQDPRAGPYGHHAQQHAHAATMHQSARAYPPDPRYTSPGVANGYPPPGSQQHMSQQGHGYLPPLQQQQQPPDSRSGAYPPPPEHRGGYYDERRPPPPYQAEQAPDTFYYRAAQGQAIPPNYSRDFRVGPPGPYAEYAQGPGNAPPMAQAAPRQRTSIACRYCRKRKIRCSGYQSAPGGKCQNCARMNQECIFQPVSSSSSAAFIPVSAVPGGVPPGTQLFGAYGQPLTPAAAQGPTSQYAPHPGGQAAPPVGYYQQPMPSPAESYSSYNDLRADESQLVGRRRRRTPDEPDETCRLPPPRAAGGAAPDEEPRRRSPAEFSNHSSPSSHYPPFHGTQPASSGGQHPPGHGGRSPIGQDGSSGGSTPGRHGAPPANQGQQSTPSVMSVSNLVDIDRTMIDRLNRPRDSSQVGGGGRAEVPH